MSVYIQELVGLLILTSSHLFWFDVGIKLNRAHSCYSIPTLVDKFRILRHAGVEVGPRGDI